MKILHTGDLHLGKYLFEYSLLDDQIVMLDCLIDELRASHTDGEPYDALIIAGDIYDRSIPPPEAVTVFDRFLTQLHTEFPALHLLITTGNHDSAKRLSYGSAIFDRFKIHVRTDDSRIAEPIILTDKDGFSAAFYLIPFLNAGDMTFDQAVGQAVSSLEQLRASDSAHTSKTSEHAADAVRSAQAGVPADSRAGLADIPAVISAHIFTLGALQSDSERVFLGTAEQIDASLFEPFAYAALGHIHKPQKIADRVQYAGSPIAYSFSEAGYEKSFCRVTLTADSSPQKAAVTVERVPVTPMRRMTRLEDYFAAFYESTAYGMYKNDYLEITLKDALPVENAGNILQQKFPYIMNVRQSFKTSSSENTNSARRALFEKQQTVHPCDIFDAFLADIHDNIESLDFTEEKKVFAELASQAENDEN